MTPFKVLWKSLKLYYEEMFPLLLMSGITALSWLLIIPGPFALAGLWYAAQKAVHNRGVSWRDYWDGVKQYGGKTWLVVLVEGVGGGLILLNLWFYNSDISPISSSTLLMLVDSMWLLVGFVVLGTFFYLEGFLLEQEEANVRLALRNSFYLTLLHPVESLIWGAISWLVLGLSAMVPVFLLITPGYLALLSLVAVRTLVKPMVDAHKSQQTADEIQEEV